MPSSVAHSRSHSISSQKVASPVLSAAQLKKIKRDKKIIKHYERLLLAGSFHTAIEKQLAQRYKVSITTVQRTYARRLKE